MLYHSLYPENISISKTELGWEGRRAVFSTETSPQDLARAHREYFDAGCDFAKWIEKKGLQDNPAAAKKEWQRIRRLALETLYLFTINGPDDYLKASVICERTW